MRRVSRAVSRISGGDGEGVAAHVDVLEGVVSSRVGGDGAGGGSAGVDEGDLGSGDERAAGVAHGAEDGAEGGLRQQGAGGDGQQATDCEEPPGHGMAKAGRGRKAAHQDTFHEEFTEETAFLRLLSCFSIQM